MRHAALLTMALLGAIVFVTQDASAQLAGNKAFSLTGTGFASSGNSISDSNIDLSFLTTKTKNTISFDFQDGKIVINSKEMVISDLSGTVQNNGKVFRFTAKASDSDIGNVSIKALGRLIDKTAADSIYSLSITLTDSKKETTKLVYTTKISEFTPKTTQAAKSGVTIKILKGSANPNERTYKDQSAGFTFKYFSEDRIVIKPGETITFVNEDTTSHSLKSGTANYVSRHKTFNPDGKFASGEILPGKSWSVTFDEQGFYRLFDENYQWMDITAFVFEGTTEKPIKSNKPLN
jgi:plastocyanin